MLWVKGSDYENKIYIYILIKSKKYDFLIERVELSDEWMRHDMKPRVWSDKDCL